MAAARDGERVLRSAARAARALERTLLSVLRTDSDGIWRFTAYRQHALSYNRIVRQAQPFLSAPVPVGLFDEEKLPNPGDTMAQQQREIFETVLANVSMLCACLEEQSGVSDAESLELRDFIAANLRRAMRNAPEREIDVQDVLEHLLIGRGLAKGTEYDRETGRVKHSGKESVPDFVLPPQDIAIEVKLAKKAADVSRLVDEINADIRAYSTGYRELLFVVYDLGAIRDEAEFRRGFEVARGTRVLVVKH